MDNVAELKVFRDKIDELDQQIILLIAKRINICREVAFYKKENNISMMQAERVKIVIKKSVDIGKRLNLSERFMATIYQEIINEACRVEDDIIGS